MHWWCAQYKPKGIFQGCCDRHVFLIQVVRCKNNGKPDQQQTISFTDGEDAGISDNSIVCFANSHLAQDGQDQNRTLQTGQD